MVPKLLILCTALCALLGAPIATAQLPADSPHLETPDDPPAPLGKRPRSVPPADWLIRAGFTSIQANVDGDGLNIVGDAANEPSIGVDPTAPNRMVIGWRQFDTITSNFRQAGYAWSHDGGRTWTFPGVHDPGVFRSDPVVDTDDEGTFYYLSLRVTNNYRCHIYRSFDGGITWDGPHLAYGGDKSWFSVDKTRGIGRGNIYEAWNTAGNSYYPAQFTRSTDGGTAFSYPEAFDNNARPVFGTTAIGPDGELYVAGIPNGWTSSFLWVLRSDDARDPAVTDPTFRSSTISLPRGEFILNGSPNPVGLLAQVWCAVDHSDGPTRGNVYIAATVDGSVFNTGAQTDIAFYRSTDGGLSWTGPIKVNDDATRGAWRWFSTMSVAPDGRIDMIWNDTRNSGQTNICELFYSLSTDAGDTWAAGQVLSQPFNSYLGWPNQDKLGDYYDMVSDLTGAHVAYAATFNGEQDVYYLRIGDYDCNGNGVGDDEDIATGFSGDCNADGIPDECEIAAGTLVDSDGNGIPDECECPPDYNGDGQVNSQDFILFLNLFTALDPLADYNGDGSIDSQDFVAFLNDFVAGC